MDDIKVPLRVISLDPEVRDPLDRLGFKFGFHKALYEVVKVARRRRRVVKLLGITDGKNEVRITGELDGDPLSKVGKMFLLEGVVYRINSSSKNRERTVKCLGRVDAEEAHG